MKRVARAKMRGVSGKPIFAVFIMGMVMLLFFYWPYNFGFPAKINRYPMVDGPIVNPLMGWAPWATANDIQQPHTLIYVDLTWREFEPEEGVFDFSSFEKIQRLDYWRSSGKRVVFRFVLDVPRADAHMDIPDWLFEKIDGKGEFYDNEYGMGFSPDYSNPVLIHYHELVIKTLGDRYGKDDFFAFVELGSLGHWGEWHVYNGLTKLPDEGVRNTYVSHYVDAFPNSFLLTRRPFTITRDLDLGLFNDMTGSVKDTNIWLDWIANGGVYLPGEQNTLAPMPNGWLVAPVGGEQAPNLSDDHLYSGNLAVTLDLLTRSHTTFIGPGGPYGVNRGSSIQPGLDEVIATIGYRLYFVKTQIPEVVYWGNELKLTGELSNAGIAPFYFDWPVYLYLYNHEGEELERYLISLDVRKIVPGEIYSFSHLVDISRLHNGRYTLGLAIIDPLNGMPAVRFANENSRDDLIQHLGEFEIKRWFGK